MMYSELFPPYSWSKSMSAAFEAISWTCLSEMSALNFNSLMIYLPIAPDRATEEVVFASNAHSWGFMSEIFLSVWTAGCDRAACCIVSHIVKVRVTVQEYWTMEMSSCVVRSREMIATVQALFSFLFYKYNTTSAVMFAK
jgi:hypothetical protein